MAVLLALTWGQASILSAVVACVAVLGHMFPLYHGFRVGKAWPRPWGATSHIDAAVVRGLLVWLVVVAIWRYVSVGSILAALVVPLLAVLWSYHWSRGAGCRAGRAAGAYKHRDNFYRLRQGSEAKFF